MHKDVGILAISKYSIQKCCIMIFSRQILLPKRDECNTLKLLCTFAFEVKNSHLHQQQVQILTLFHMGYFLVILARRGVFRPPNCLLNYKRYDNETW